MLQISLPKRNSDIDYESRGYEVICFVGKGTYGSAYRVRRQKDGTEWLAKAVDLSQLAGRDKAMCIQEAELMQSLDHDGIVKCEETFIHEHTNLVIIMEYCGNGDLEAEIRRRKEVDESPTEEEVARVSTQLLSALVYMGSRRVIHRDIKPSNIFFDTLGNVKVGDFGISKVLNATRALAQTAVGTPQYMSPEMCENKPYTSKSDIWALGCCLYEYCTLKPAFGGDSLLGLVWNISFKSIDPLPQNKYPRDLQLLLNKMLAKDPSHRKSARALLDDSFFRPYRHLLSPSMRTPKHLMQSSEPEDGGRRTSVLEAADDFVDTIIGKLKYRLEARGIEIVDALADTFMATPKLPEELLDSIAEEEEECPPQESMKITPQLIRDMKLNQDWMERASQFYRLGLDEDEVNRLLYHLDGVSHTRSSVTDLDDVVRMATVSKYIDDLRWCNTILRERVDGSVRTGNLGLLEGFEQFDSLLEGLVLRKHFRAVLHLYAPTLRFVELDRLYRISDKTPDGKVVYKDFINAIWNVPNVQVTDECPGRVEDEGCRGLRMTDESEPCLRMTDESEPSIRMLDVGVPKIQTSTVAPEEETPFCTPMPTPYHSVDNTPIAKEEGGGDWKLRTASFGEGLLQSETPDESILKNQPFEAFRLAFQVASAVEMERLLHVKVLKEFMSGAPGEGESELRGAQVALSHMLSSAPLELKDMEKSLPHRKMVGRPNEKLLDITSKTITKLCKIINQANTGIHEARRSLDRELSDATGKFETTLNLYGGELRNLVWSVHALVEAFCEKTNKDVLELLQHQKTILVIKETMHVETAHVAFFYNERGLVVVPDWAVETGLCGELIVGLLSTVRPMEVGVASPFIRNEESLFRGVEVGISEWLCSTEAVADILTEVQNSVFNELKRRIHPVEPRSELLPPTSGLDQRRLSAPELNIRLQADPKPKWRKAVRSSLSMFKALTKR